MAEFDCAAFLTIMIIFQTYVTGIFGIPFISPSLGNSNPCGETNACGKGNCVISSSTTFGYECECESGWKQARSQDDKYLNFLPCVIPNCTLDFKCANAHAPASHDQTIPNISFLDPCFWAYCGGGSCRKTSIFTHTCECEEGYYNLFNSTAFPCYQECAFGLDCASLGLNTNNLTSSRPNKSPGLADNSESNALSLLPRIEFGLLISLATTLALGLVRKQQF